MKIVTFFETGFNASNIPDSPDLLAQCVHGEYDAIDILQDDFLDNVRIRVSTGYRDIENVDYCYIERIPKTSIVPYDSRLGRRYYFVTAIEMLAYDTAKLYLQPDYLSTCGGAKHLGNTQQTVGGTWGYPQILDGITERVHVAKNLDVFGAYTEDDPILTPVNPLQLRYEVLRPQGDGEVTLVESTVDLYHGANSTTALTYTDPASQESVTVPYMPVVPSTTEHQYGGQRGTLTYSLDYGVDSAVKDMVKRGMLRARGLGMESAIIAQYKVPTSFISGFLTHLDIYTGAISELNGIQQELAPETLVWEQSNSVQNKRVLYGSFTKYGLLTMAGNKCEFKAEEIYDTVDNYNHPVVVVKPDLRSDGRPYYRFRRYLNDATANGFWRNALAGEQWQNVPLVYAGESRNELNRLTYEASRTTIKTGYDTARDVLTLQSLGNIVGGVANRYAGAYTSDVFSTGLQPTGNNRAFSNPTFSDLGGMVGGAAGTMADAYVKGEAMRAMYRAQGAESALRYAASHEVVAPEIQFPYVSNIMRDALGNGVIAYRYYYTDYDLARIDRLLTMYGYRVSRALSNADFNSRSKFNYVKAHGVTLGGVKDGKGYPQRLLNGAAEQLEGGVRVWHVLPDPVYYTNGTNI